MNICIFVEERVCVTWPIHFLILEQIMKAISKETFGVARSNTTVMRFIISGEDPLAYMWGMIVWSHGATQSG